MTKHLLIEKYVAPIRLQGGYNSNLPMTLNGTSASLSVGGNLTVTGTQTQTGITTFSAAPVFAAGLTASGAVSNDFSGSTGTFKTSTGTVTLGGSTTVPTGKTLTVTDSAGLTVGGAVMPIYEYITSPTFAAASFVNGTGYPLYTFPNDGTTWKLVFASCRFTTAASSAATATITLDGVAAPGAGTAQFAAMALNGSANTVVNAATPVNTTTAAGNSIGLLAGGAATTGLVGLVVTIVIQRLT